jgi:hypothetical protein
MAAVTAAATGVTTAASPSASSSSTNYRRPIEDEESSTGGAQSVDYERQHGHFFSKKTFHRPTYCHHCTDMLWGLIGQGYLCEGVLLVFSVFNNTYQVFFSVVIVSAIIDSLPGIFKVCIRLPGVPAIISVDSPSDLWALTPSNIA